uniref:Uncharacterized protein n=1 Tax=Odontella aurita TaxID=265563 RepID=A0A6U6DF33_9STRA
MIFASERGYHNVRPLMEKATLAAADAVDRAISSTHDELYPHEEYMIAGPLLSAVAVSFFFCLALAAAYVPSYASTALRFRSGTIALLRDRQAFGECRTGMEEGTVLLGSMFWGALVSSLLLGVAVGVFVFLLLWQVTRAALMDLTALLIGLGIIAIMKLTLTNVGLRSAYVGFYRRKIALSNVYSMLLECANIAFTVLTALVRAGFLVAIAGLYIGRMDTPLLAPGVGVGSLRDKYPTIFRKEILAKEAHRHPYVEVLGKMFLMKLRHGERFCSRAGCCFRLVFTLALMPWLRKYRVMARPDLLGKNIATGHEAVDSRQQSALFSSTLRQSAIMASMSMAASLPSNRVLIESSNAVEVAPDTASESDVHLLQVQLSEKEEELKLLLQELKDAKAKIVLLQT